MTQYAMKLKDIKSPVPSDIDIAQAAELYPISRVAEQVGLQADEVDNYGAHKAKASLLRML